MKHLDHETHDRLMAMLRACTDRDAVMIRLTLELGLRAQELLNITHADINRHQKVITIKTLKNGRQRVLPMPGYLEAYLTDCAQPDQTSRIFPITYKRLWQIWQQWRPQGHKFHALRHTFARRLYTKRRDIRLVQKALGHKSLSSTTIYLDEEYSMNDMRKAFGIK